MGRIDFVGGKGLVLEIEPGPRACEASPELHSQALRKKNS
jgi:hypothetical protein